MTTDSAEPGRLRPGGRVTAVILVLLVLGGMVGWGQAAESKPTTSPAGAANIAKKEVLRSALSGKYPPFSYYDENGELAGFDVDVSREIAKRLGMKSQILAIEWDGILAGLLNGKYDAIIASMAVTPKRAEVVDFSSPYYLSGAQLFVHRSNPGKIYSINDCKGKRIAAVLGETYERFIEENYPEVELVSLKSSSDIFEMLSRNRIDGFVTDRLVGQYQIKKAGRNFVPVGEMLYREKIAIPVKKEDKELLQGINNALGDMESDGTLRRLTDKYFGTGAEGLSSSGMSTKVIAGKLLAGFGVTLAIAIGSIALGLLLAIPCGLLLAYPVGGWRVPSLLARTVVDFIRGTPVLIQLFFVFFGFDLPAYAAAVLTLGINAMAYMSEVVRSGLLGVDPGQARAAGALGLNKFQQFRHVIWPQAFRIAIPPLMNSIVALIKDTALVSVISISEVIREAQSIISVNFEPTKYYFIVAVMFFVVTFPLMKIAGVIEKRIKSRGFIHD